MKIRFMRKVKPSGEVFYYTEIKRLFFWEYVDLSISMSEKIAREKFQMIIDRHRDNLPSELIEILEEKEV